jgi:hypothetical protein
MHKPAPNADDLPVEFAQEMWDGKRSTPLHDKTAVKQINRNGRAAREEIGIKAARAMFEKEAAKFASRRHIPKSVFAILARRIDAVGRVFSQPIARPKGRAGSSMRAVIIMDVARDCGLTERMVTRCWTRWRAELKRLRRDLDSPTAAMKARALTAAAKNPKGSGRKPLLTYRERRRIGIECESRFDALAVHAAGAGLAAKIDGARPPRRRSG